MRLLVLGFGAGSPGLLVLLSSSTTIGTFHESVERFLERGQGWLFAEVVLCFVIAMNFFVVLKIQLIVKIETLLFNSINLFYNFSINAQLRIL